jgi:hypothetical protein
MDDQNFLEKLNQDNKAFREGIKSTIGELAALKRAAIDAASKVGAVAGGTIGSAATYGLYAADAKNPVRGVADAITFTNAQEKGGAAIAKTLEMIGDASTKTGQKVHKAAGLIRSFTNETTQLAESLDVLAGRAGIVSKTLTGMTNVFKLATGPIGQTIAITTIAYDQFIDRAVKKFQEFEKVRNEAVKSFEEVARRERLLGVNVAGRLDAGARSSFLEQASRSGTSTTGLSRLSYLRAAGDAGAMGLTARQSDLAIRYGTAIARETGKEVSKAIRDGMRDVLAARAMAGSDSIESRLARRALESGVSLAYRGAPTAGQRVDAFLQDTGRDFTQFGRAVSNSWDSGRSNYLYDSLNRIPGISALRLGRAGRGGFSRAVGGITDIAATVTGVNQLGSVGRGIGSAAYGLSKWYSKRDIELGQRGIDAMRKGGYDKSYVDYLQLEQNARASQVRADQKSEELDRRARAELIALEPERQALAERREKIEAIRAVRNNQNLLVQKDRIGKRIYKIKNMIESGGLSKERRKELSEELIRLRTNERDIGDSINRNNALVKAQGNTFDVTKYTTNFKFIEDEFKKDEGEFKEKEDKILTKSIKSYTGRDINVFDYLGQQNIERAGNISSLGIEAPISFGENLSRRIAKGFGFNPKKVYSEDEKKNILDRLVGETFAGLDREQAKLQEETETRRKKTAGIYSGEGAGIILPELLKLSESKEDLKNVINKLSDEDIRKLGQGGAVEEIRASLLKNVNEGTEGDRGRVASQVSEVLKKKPVEFFDEFEGSISKTVEKILKDGSEIAKNSMKALEARAINAIKQKIDKISSKEAEKLKDYTKETSAIQVDMSVTRGEISAKDGEEIKKLLMSDDKSKVAEGESRLRENARRISLAGLKTQKELQSGELAVQQISFGISIDDAVLDGAIDPSKAKELKKAMESGDITKRQDARAKYQMLMKEYATKQARRQFEAKKITKSYDVNQTTPFLISRAQERGFISAGEATSFGKMNVNDDMTRNQLQSLLKIKEDAFEQELQFTIRYTQLRMDVLEKHYEQAISAETLKLEGKDRAISPQLQYGRELFGISQAAAGAVMGSFAGEDYRRGVGRQRRALHERRQMMSMSFAGVQLPEYARMGLALRSQREQEEDFRRSLERQKLQDRMQIGSVQQTLESLQGQGIGQEQLQQTEGGLGLLLQMFQGAQGAYSRSGRNVLPTILGLLGKQRQFAAKRLGLQTRTRGLRSEMIQKQISTLEEGGEGLSEEARGRYTAQLAGKYKEASDFYASIGDVKNFEKFSKKFEEAYSKIPDQFKAIFDDQQKLMNIELQKQTEILNQIADNTGGKTKSAANIKGSGKGTAANPNISLPGVDANAKINTPTDLINESGYRTNNPNAKPFSEIGGYDTRTQEEKDRANYLVDFFKSPNEDKTTTMASIGWSDYKGMNARTTKGPWKTPDVFEGGIGVNQLTIGGKSGGVGPDNLGQVELAPYDSGVDVDKFLDKGFGKLKMGKISKKGSIYDRMIGGIPGDMTSGAVGDFMSIQGFSGITDSPTIQDEMKTYSSPDEKNMSAVDKFSSAVDKFADTNITVKVDGRGANVSSSGVGNYGFKS